MGQKVDLHMHSRFSDGEFSPSGLVRQCAAFGIKIVAITDHDASGGIPEAMEAGREHGVKVIPGAELSAIYGEYEFHILILGFDHENALLNERLGHIQESRIERIVEIGNRLSRLGINFIPREAMEMACGAVGKPHIALAALKRTENANIFERDHVLDVDGFIKCYLSNGKPANVPREKFSVEETISLAHQAGGKAFFAHPKLALRDDFSDKIFDVAGSLCAMGLDGLEVFHSGHKKDSTLTLRKVAAKYNLLESAGSDFHGPKIAPHIRLGGWKSFGLIPDFSWLEK